MFDAILNQARLQVYMRTIYLAKRSSVEEEAATVGQNHFHVLLDRWKPLALDSLEEVSHLRSQKSI